MSTSSSSIAAGSYWRSKTNGSLVKVIIPNAEGWTYRDQGTQVIFRTYSDRHGNPMPIRQHYEPLSYFTVEFELAIWDKENRTWR